MSVSLLAHNELRDIQRELEQALYNHVQWYNSLIRSLVCQLPADKHDTNSEPHKECLFGQWYYEHAPKKLIEHPTFLAIGDAHQKMHRAAAVLLKKSNVGNHVEPTDFDSFSNAMEGLRLEIAALKREVESLLYTRDPLTGAINRIDMMPMLRELHELVKREAQVSCLAMMDLDHFKKINDEHGHPVGDKVLFIIASHILSNLRSYDKMFRFGGEEFLLSMQNTSLENCHQRIEKIRQDIAKLPIDIGHRDPVYITVSFGLTELRPDSAIEECIERADQALYDAKIQGRNCTRTWVDPS